MAASEGIDQASLIRSLLDYMGEVTGIGDLKLEQTIDGQSFIQLLFRIDEDYFKQSAINISQDPIKQHGWVLNAARLKRIYLRLMGHFSFSLQLDPSRLLVPDCNVIAKKGVGWEAHWLRLAALVFFALYRSDPVVKSRFTSIPVISAWIKQIECRLERGSGSSIEFESSPPSLYSLDIPDYISSSNSSTVPSSGKSAPMGTITPPPTWPLNPAKANGKTVPSIYPSLDGKSGSTHSSVGTAGEPQVNKEQSRNILKSNEKSHAAEKAKLLAEAEEADSRATEAAEELEACKSTYEAKIQNLQSELAKSKKAEPSEDLNYIEEIAVLEIELDGTKAKLRKESDRAQRLQGLVNEQSEKIEALDYANVELKADIEEKDTALARLEDELETTKSTKASKEESELSNELKSLKEELARQVPLEMLEEEKQRSQVYADNIVVLEKMIEGMDSELSEAQQMLASSAKRIRELEELASRTDQGLLVKMLEDELVRKNEELEAARMENEATKSQLGEALRSLAGLQTQSLSAPASVSADASLQEELALKNQLIADLEEALAFERSKPAVVVDTSKDQLIADLEEALAYEKRNVETLSKGINTDQERILLLQQQLKAIEQDYERQKGLLGELEGNIRVERENSAMLKEALELKETQLNSAKTDPNLSAHLTRLKETESALTKQVDDLKSKLKYSQNEANQSHKKIFELEEQLAQREEDLKSKSESEESSLSNSLAEKDDQIYKLESELALLNHSKAQLDKLERTLTAKDRKISELEGMLAELEEELAELRIQMTAVESKQQNQANSQSEEFEAEKNKITASIEDLKQQIREHSSHLAKLTDIQTKIDSALQTVELDRINPIERFFGTEQFAFDSISSSFTKLKDISGHAGEKLQTLTTIQEKIEQMHDSLETDRIGPLEMHISRLEHLLQDIEVKVSELKEQKEITKSKSKMNSEEQQMILAAWHDLGLKIMKMKTIEK